MSKIKLKCALHFRIDEESYENLLELEVLSGRDKSKIIRDALAAYLPEQLRSINHEHHKRTAIKHTEGLSP